MIQYPPEKPATAIEKCWESEGCWAMCCFFDMMAPFRVVLGDMTAGLGRGRLGNRVGKSWWWYLSSFACHYQLSQWLVI